MALMRGSTSQNGSAIYILFVAVALFGLLTYVLLQNSRGNMSMVSGEAAKAAAYQSQDCANSFNAALKRLKLRGCADISYSPDGTNSLAGAPTDGSCSVFHPNGGGAKFCEGMILCSKTQLAALPIGGRCANIVYAGLSPDGNKRMYTTSTDAAGLFFYNNNGNAAGAVYVSGASSTSNGLNNTEALVATDSDSATAGFQPHQAAEYCYNLSVDGYDDWYLPALFEIGVMAANKIAIGGFNLSGDYYQGWYKSSSNNGPADAGAYRMSDSAYGGANSKLVSQKIRCVRK